MDDRGNTVGEEQPATGGDPTEGFGSGIVGGLTARTAVYFSIGTIAAFAVVAWALTSKRRKVS